MGEWGVPSKPVSTPVNIGPHIGHHTIENKFRTDPAFSSAQLKAFESIPYYYLPGSEVNSRLRGVDANGQAFRWPKYIMYFECDRQGTFERFAPGAEFKRIYSRLGKMRGRWVIRRNHHTDPVHRSKWMCQDDPRVVQKNGIYMFPKTPTESRWFDPAYQSTGVT